MVEVPSGRDPITWDQLVQAKPEVAQDWDEMKKYRKETGIHVH